VLKQLFHEVAGAVFGILALTWLNSAVRAWTRDVAHWLIALAVCVGCAIWILFRNAICSRTQSALTYVELKSPAKEAKERRERFSTASGLPLERLYTEETLAGWDAGGGALAIPENFRTRAGFILRCIAGGCGLCGSTRALDRRRNPTSVTGIC